MGVAFATGVLPGRRMYASLFTDGPSTASLDVTSSSGALHLAMRQEKWCCVTLQRV